MCLPSDAMASKGSGVLPIKKLNPDKGDELRILPNPFLTIPLVSVSSILEKTHAFTAPIAFIGF